MSKGFGNATNGTVFDELVDILHICLREGDYEESDEIAEDVIVDFDEEGKPMAIEILDASHLC